MPITFPSHPTTTGPGTSHLGMLERTNLLLAMVPTFLDAPEPEPGTPSTGDPSDDRV